MIKISYIEFVIRFLICVIVDVAVYRVSNKYSDSNASYRQITILLAVLNVLIMLYRW